jgi:mono/diheme cytochrome c family protein
VALIAYIKSLPPVDHIVTPIRIGLIGRLLHVTGLATVAPAEIIDHAAPRPQTVAKGRTKEYGAYLANICKGCHGAELSGGAIPGASAEQPDPANLTPDPVTGLGQWQEADFVTAMRTGVRPDGTQLATQMPWQAFQHMTDEELGALWLYLQAVPAKPEGNR